MFCESIGKGMSLSIQASRKLIASMQSTKIQNLVAQSKAKQVLREVNEKPDNFPKFENDLDDRVTYIAYARLSAGCSLIEKNEINEGYEQLHSAADILESNHRNQIDTSDSSALHCLLGAMAFYGCGHYSRAFILIKKVQNASASAGIIAAYLRKDMKELVSKLNAVLLEAYPEFEDQSQFNEWAVSNCIARAVSHLIEHIITGQSELLKNSIGILDDAMIISEGGSDTSLWWQCRLLKLMFKDYSEMSLWTILPPYFGSDGLSKIENYVRLLALQTPPVVELWKSQIAALELALNTENKGGVINLRTSAGKTRVAELAILQALKADPFGKVLYLAPFRSLAFELERTFSKTLSPLGYQVSHLYGGSRYSSVDKELVVEGNITIATPEKAKAMLRADPELFASIKLIVIDEGHLLGDSARNIRNELFLEHLRILARQAGARILLLSAVLPNAEDLASWVGGHADAVIKSEWKPSAERFGTLRWRATGVSIEWLGGQRCFNPHFIDFRQVRKSLKKTRTFPENKTEAVAATAIRLAELGPVLIFAGQARWVPSMVKAVLLALGEDAEEHPWPTTEWRLFEAICLEELGENSLELKAAKMGVICHSNKLPTQVRIAIEKLMAKFSPKVIVATTTLGQGVNIGISSVIIATTWIGQNQISKRDFWNICGRAGRAFIDSEGKVLYAVDLTQKDWQIRSAESSANYYFDRTGLDHVKSGLLQLVHALVEIAAEADISFEVLLELIANNNFAPLQANKENVESALDLIDDQILALHIAYTNDTDELSSPSWIDQAFQDSLAAIQEKNLSNKVGDLLSFLEARANGVLLMTPPSARGAIVASGLPLSVGLAAFNQLDIFRELVDQYLNSEATSDSLNRLVEGFELWALENALSLIGDVPSLEALSSIRSQWLAGLPMIQVIETSGAIATDVCSDFYGYKLPWLLHAVAQKLDKTTEEDRIDLLAMVSLLVELGLPNEASAKIFLAGVRSRSAAVELGQYVTNPKASINSIRSALLDSQVVKDLSNTLSKSTLDWLELLSGEHGNSTKTFPRSANFTLNTSTSVPEDVHTLYVRKSPVSGNVYLSSIDGRFKVSVSSTETLPFETLADDLRFVFKRHENIWVQFSRDI